MILEFAMDRRTIKGMNANLIPVWSKCSSALSLRDLR